MATDPAIFDRVVALGDRNSKTLGFLPYAGFRAAAADNRIAVASAPDGSLLGYCLFDLPRDVVRIVHVCVSDDGRQSGLARALVDAVSARHADRLGLVLKCRADWPADRMWPKLQFTAQTQVPGRSRDKHPLTVWWRSHGHADLFTLLEQGPTGRVAAIDSNIYSDLHSARARQGFRDTATLAPLIANGELTLVLLPTLEEEIYATKDTAERTRFLNAKVNYRRTTAKSSQDLVDRLTRDIVADALAKDPSLHTDARLLAEAQANDVSIFITRDRAVLEHLAEPAAELGIDVLHPTDVPTYFDVEQAHHSYQPAQLKETTYTIRRLDRPLSTNETAALLDKAGGERLTDLRQLLADLARRSTGDVERKVLLDAEGNLHATWTEQESDALEVAFLRVRDGRLQGTLAAQLSQMLRADAVARNKSVLRITDAHVHKVVRSVLEADGFYADPDGLIALALPMISDWPTVSAAARAIAAERAESGLFPLVQLPQNPSLTQSVEFERMWAPAKILGQGIANYLIPIRRAFASQLLGYPPSLMFRPDDLGLSREHVYYGSRRGPVKAPARILWYVSGKTDPGVIATSSLVEVRVDTPKRLHRLYARLGVWSEHDIQSASSSGRAAAFRFTHTEVFGSPVRLDRVRALAPHGQKLLLRSAQQLDDGWYEPIYREGTQL